MHCRGEVKHAKRHERDFGQGMGIFARWGRGGLGVPRKVPDDTDSTQHTRSLVSPRATKGSLPQRRACVRHCACVSTFLAELQALEIKVVMAGRPHQLDSKLLAPCCWPIGAHARFKDLVLVLILVLLVFYSLGFPLFSSCCCARPRAFCGNGEAVAEMDLPASLGPCDLGVASKEWVVVDHRVWTSTYSARPDSRFPHFPAAAS